MSSQTSAGLGIVTADPMGEVLGTGYKRFESPFGVNGLAKESSERVDILALVSDEEGKGHFRAFIARCLAIHHTVCVWEVWNPILGAALRRYGFRPAWETDRFGDVLSGLALGPRAAGRRCTMQERLMNAASGKAPMADELPSELTKAAPTEIPNPLVQPQGIPSIEDDFVPFNPECYARSRLRLEPENSRKTIFATEICSFRHRHAPPRPEGNIPWGKAN